MPSSQRREPALVYPWLLTPRFLKPGTPQSSASPTTRAHTLCSWWTPVLAMTTCGTRLWAVFFLQERTSASPLLETQSLWGFSRMTKSGVYCGTWSKATLKASRGFISAGFLFPFLEIIRVFLMMAKRINTPRTTDSLP